MQQRRTFEQTNWLIRRLQAVMSSFGYAILETPILDSADLFLTRAGDQIIGRLFTFERFGQQLALRPEFTAAAAHAYLTSQRTSIARWQFAGATFEDDGGQFQKMSLGAELIGMAGVSADAEIMAMAASGLDDVGIRDWRIVIGHVQLMRQLLKRYHLDARTERFLLNHLHTLKEYGKERILAELDRLLLIRPEAASADVDLNVVNTQQMLDVLLDATQHGTAMGGRTRDDIVRRLLQKRQRAAERSEIVAALDFLELWSAIIGDAESAFQQIERLIEAADADALQTLEQWRETIRLLSVYGIPVERTLIQPGLARNWDYYTGLVFEIHGDVLLAGGGRYDELTRLIGGEHETPAVGFAYYVDQLVEAAAIEPEFDQIVTISFAPNRAVEAVQWAQVLRRNGIPAEIIPQTDEEAESAATVNADGSLHHAGNDYQLDQLSRLVENLQ